MEVIRIGFVALNVFSAKFATVLGFGEKRFLLGLDVVELGERFKK